MKVQTSPNGNVGKLDEAGCCANSSQGFSHDEQVRFRKVNMSSKCSGQQKMMENRLSWQQFYYRLAVRYDNAVSQVGCVSGTRIGFYEFIVL